VESVPNVSRYFYSQLNLLHAVLARDIKVKEITFKTNKKQVAQKKRADKETAETAAVKETVRDFVVLKIRETSGYKMDVKEFESCGVDYKSWKSHKRKDVTGAEGREVSRGAECAEYAGQENAGMKMQD